LKLGADFIVNTDGDNQYAGADRSKRSMANWCGRSSPIPRR